MQQPKIMFCKIIEIDGKQVLAMKTEQDDGAPSLTSTAEVFFGRVAIELAFETEEARDKAFDEYNVDIAKGVIEQVVGIENNFSQ